jgi:hypothetical protein
MSFSRYRMSKVANLAFLIALVVARTLAAQTSVRDYEALRATQRFSDYILGIGNGYVWANRELIREGKQPLYCQPNGVVLDSAKYLKILDAAVAVVDEAHKTSTFVEAALLSSLRASFPCSLELSPAPAVVPLRIDGAMLRRVDEVFHACKGLLEVTPTTFAWRDSDACWSGPDIAVSVKDVEWIRYRIGTFATDVFFKLKGREPLAFFFKGTEPQKMYRYLAEHGSSISQDCFTGRVEDGVSHENPVSCVEWTR